MIVRKYKEKATQQEFIRYANDEYVFGDAADGSQDKRVTHKQFESDYILIDAWEEED